MVNVCSFYNEEDLLELIGHERVASYILELFYNEDMEVTKLGLRALGNMVEQNE